MPSSGIERVPLKLWVGIPVGSIPKTWKTALAAPPIHSIWCAVSVDECQRKASRTVLSLTNTKFTAKLAEWLSMRSKWFTKQMHRTLPCFLKNDTSSSFFNNLHTYVYLFFVSCFRNKLFKLARVYGRHVLRSSDPLCLVADCKDGKKLSLWGIRNPNQMCTYASFCKKRKNQCNQLSCAGDLQVGQGVETCLDENMNSTQARL